MAIEGFDYQGFAKGLAEQANELLPANFDNFQKGYVINTIMNFSSLAGEALYNDTESNFSADQAMFITQIIAEWSFHKSVDLIKSGIMQDYWDSVMQKIAFTIFEIGKQAIGQNLPQDEVLGIVEHHVHKSYEEALQELKQNKIISDKVFDQAVHQSNIDEMMEQIQEEKRKYEEELSKSGGNLNSGPVKQSDSKILKLASVALLLRQVSQDKVQTILNKFDPQDAQVVIQYMQMPDLESKVDRNIAIKCLQEIRTNLPETSQMSSSKLLGKFKNIFEKKERVQVEASIKTERPNVKNLVKSVYDGELTQIPSKVANIIAQHLEESE